MVLVWERPTVRTQEGGPSIQHGETNICKSSGDKKEASGLSFSLSLSLSLSLFLLFLSWQISENQKYTGQI